MSHLPKSIPWSRGTVFSCDRSSMMLMTCSLLSALNNTCTVIAAVTLSNKTSQLMVHKHHAMQALLANRARTRLAAAHPCDLPALGIANGQKQILSRSVRNQHAAAQDSARGELTCRRNAKTATASNGRGSKLSKPMMRSHSRSTSPTARWPAKAVMIQGRARCRGGQPRPLRCWATSPSLSYTLKVNPLPDCSLEAACLMLTY